MSDKNNCPLCHHTQTNFYHRDKQRQYLQCQQCLLVFVTPEYLPGIAKEKQEYDLHQNSSEDMGYRNFLARLSLPLMEKLTPESQGLDFGCGPGPALHLDFKEAGHKVELYDPIYFPHTEFKEKKFDFITCTEAIEHFHQPEKEWKLWMQILKPNARLAIMTKRVTNLQAFARWHYKNDQTHVCFFSDYTFEWLAETYALSLEFISKDIVILQKLP